ncbi:MAG: hypothetical protein K2K82_05000 [Muribaculaceae bacterium]|nr:hypothetical protein [Muribaculaceae bacterium]
MKSKVFMLLAAELLPVVANACGPFNPIIPTPPYFVTEGNEPTDYNRIENLKLWQSQISDQIPLAEIEQVVYADSHDRFNEMTNPNDRKSTLNRMYIYLNDSNNTEAIEFLSLAKGIEEARRDDERRSPWYYPSKRNDERTTDGLDYFIRQAMNYDGENFKERYAMQVCRALFATNQFARCVEYYDSIFSGIDDASLMKRMAGNYAGGSLIHLGDTVKANTLFALAGDYNSLFVENPMEYMLDQNPNAPQIMDYMRSYVAADSARMAQHLPLAVKALANRDVTYKGDWAFYLAYFYNHFAQAPQTAENFINKALKLQFSSDELKNQAMAYKMKFEGASLTQQSILTNLRWLDQRVDSLSPDAKDWNRRGRNIIYSDWIPQLWKRGDYATAILLADYADSKNLTDYGRDENVNPGDMDRGSLTFQLMGSLRSDQLIAVRQKIMSSTPLYDFLRREDMQNPNMFNDLIGTLALREGNYARAVDYLLQVGIDYQHSMRLYRAGYLGLDPFVYYPERWEKCEWEDWV